MQPHYFKRSCDETSYRVLEWNPDVFCFVSALPASRALRTSRSVARQRQLVKDIMCLVKGLSLEECREGEAITRRFLNTLRPRQNRRHFSYDIFECIFVNENIWISIKISLNLFLKAQLTIFRLVGAKPLSEPMTVHLLAHICVNRPRWVQAFRVELLLGKRKYIIVFFHHSPLKTLLTDDKDSCIL